MSQNPESGKFLYGIFENTCFIKGVGNLSYRIGTAFDAFIGTVLEDNAIQDFLIDLKEADYIDSTNLGLLARIQNFSANKLFKPPVILSTKEEINRILQNVGFDRLFIIIDSASAPLNLRELPPHAADSVAMEEMLLSAHKYLMNTNEKNAIAFHDVVDLLEKDMHKPNRQAARRWRKCVAD
jgi:anti-anti-sigma factor